MTVLILIIIIRYIEFIWFLFWMNYLIKISFTLKPPKILSLSHFETSGEDLLATEVKGAEGGGKLAKSECGGNPGGASQPSNDGGMRP